MRWRRASVGSTPAWVVALCIGVAEICGAQLARNDAAEVSNVAPRVDTAMSSGAGHEPVTSRWLSPSARTDGSRGGRGSTPVANELVRPLTNAEGGDVLVNDPAQDIAESTTQSEVSLGVLGDTVCAAYNDSGEVSALRGFTGFARSADRGQTWSDRGATGSVGQGDPVLAVHQSSGTFYLAELARMGSRQRFDQLVSFIRVLRSTDDCRTFDTPGANASPSAADAVVCSPLFCEGLHAVHFQSGLRERREQRRWPVRRA